jgi:hypothetical protein
MLSTTVIYKHLQFAFANMANAVASGGSHVPIRKIVASCIRKQRIPLILGYCMPQTLKLLHFAFEKQRIPLPLGDRTFQTLKLLQFEFQKRLHSKSNECL